MRSKKLLTVVEQLNVFGRNLNTVCQLMAWIDAPPLLIVT